MGIRMDQVMGLNSWASAEITSITKSCTEYRARVYDDGTIEQFDPVILNINQIKQERSKNIFYGMFDNEYLLTKYIFPDGRIMEEYVQETVWSSGPVIFLALKNEKDEPIPESLWTEKEVQSET